MAVSKPDIGKLRQSGQLQVNTPVQQGAGFKDSFATLLTCRGALSKLRANRELNSAEVNINAAWEWICRVQTAINTVANKKSMRWIIDGRTFTVNNYELIDQKKRFYRFTLLENE
jgi:hypothetical protein